MVMKKAPISEGFSLTAPILLLPYGYRQQRKQRYKMKLQILIIIILFCSCSQQKRCARHISKAKEMGCLANDTVILRDTLIGFSVDTVVQFDTMSHTDTLTIEKDGVKSITVIKWKERLVTQEITKKDTIFKREHFTVKEIKTVEKIPWWVYLVFCLGGVAILGLVFKGK